MDHPAGDSPSETATISLTFASDIPGNIHRILGVPLESIPRTHVYIKDSDGIVSNTITEDGTFEVTLSRAYLKTITPDVRSKEAEGIVYNQVAMQVLLTPKYEPLQFWFKSGVSDYVRIQLERESPLWPTRLYGGDYKAGWRSTGYFLKWVEEGDGSPKPWTIREILMAAADSSRAEKPSPILEQIIGSPTSNPDEVWQRLWDTYQLSVLENTKGMKVTTHRPRPSEPFMILIDEGGSDALLRAVPDPLHFLVEAYISINSLLYPSSSYHSRKVRQVTLVLSPTSNGVAETENDVITFAMKYINDISKSHDDAWLAREIKGVLLHEMVHVQQYSGTKDLAPGGLIEGIADYCRLRSGWAAAHWSQGPGGKWDSGYQVTGYFLDWLEKERGCTEFVAKCNEALRESSWDEKWCETETGSSWEKLWDEYQAAMKPTGTSAANRVIPTHT
ncbi:hypothetical protein FRB98_005790 [Tulasnella sp. 332]|nr:hypothetical protein FRB98_005790 [Tulasnella sp. 332]